MKTQHKQGGVNHENVMVLITICADGSALVPMIIYKGKNMMKKWGENNVAKAIIAYSENGWTNGELAPDWIEVVFNAEMKTKVADCV
ncbi:hypothetical protein CC2G_011653 [Coprinopsis cinerea AmutBmut pab1-1]|nr:hypothetical protein CC2G_011653 [Coprinopsis cinerea AmutBmut pab1-1]